jgi:alcohol dehydrogenase class IV
MMKAVGSPSGVAELGYTEADIPAIIEGAMKQQRLLAGAPKEVTPKVLEKILLESMHNW